MDKNRKIERSYLEFNNQIYNFIFRLCNNHALALDITQQTFLSALSTDIQPELTKSWFITIARNIFYQEFDFKENISFETIDESVELNFIRELHKPIPISEALKILQTNVEKSINKMSIFAREIMLLYFIENFSIIEITIITKRSLANIKVNLHHARINFEIWLIKYMSGKLAASHDQCHAYSRITKAFFKLDVPESSLDYINLHISNCKLCINNEEQLKRTGILINLTPLITTPKTLDKIIYSNLIKSRTILQGVTHEKNSHIIFS